MAEALLRGNLPPTEESRFFDDEIISRFNILNLFGQKRLEGLQSIIAKATGLAVVTLDYKGQPLTEMTAFTAFCQKMQLNEKSSALCRFSYAYGASQALANQSLFIYLCPCGLLEIAIPIIVKNHYLGCFFAGQTRCDQAPPHVPRLNKIFEAQLNDCPLNVSHKKMLKQIPSYEFAHFSAIAEMISFIITQICENELAGQVLTKEMKNDISSLKQHVKKLEAQLNLKKSEVVKLKSRLNFYFLINTLNSISNLAVIEDSPRTNEMIILFAEHLLHGLPANKNFSFLADEIENIERYLKMQKIRFGDMLNYQINMPQDAAMHNIPVHIIMPFVERAVFYGLATREMSLTVTISIIFEGRELIILVADDGPGLSDEELALEFAQFQNGYEGEAIQMGLEAAKQRLADLFGEAHTVEIKNTSGNGTEAVIKFPAAMPAGVV